SICAARPSTASTAPVASSAPAGSLPSAAITSYPWAAKASRATTRISSVNAIASGAGSAPGRGCTGSTAMRFCAAAAVARRSETMNTRKDDLPGHVRCPRSLEQLPAGAPRYAARLLCRCPLCRRPAQASGVRLAAQPCQKRRRGLCAERGALAHLLDRLRVPPIATGIPAHARPEEVLEDLDVSFVAEAVGDLRHLGAEIARHPLDDGVEVRLDELQRGFARLTGVRGSPDELDGLAGIELAAQGDLKPAADQGGIAEITHRAEDPLALDAVLLRFRRAVQDVVERSIAGDRRKKERRGRQLGADGPVIGEPAIRHGPRGRAEPLVLSLVAGQHEQRRPQEPCVLGIALLLREPERARAVAEVRAHPGGVL